MRYVRENVFLSIYNTEQRLPYLKILEKSNVWSEEVALARRIFMLPIILLNQQEKRAVQTIILLLYQSLEVLLLSDDLSAL